MNKNRDKFIIEKVANGWILRPTQNPHEISNLEEIYVFIDTFGLQQFLEKL